jgi:hypothetical protein
MVTRSLLRRLRCTTKMIGSTRLGRREFPKCQKPTVCLTGGSRGTILAFFSPRQQASTRRVSDSHTAPPADRSRTRSEVHSRYLIGRPPTIARDRAPRVAVTEKARSRSAAGSDRSSYPEGTTDRAMSPGAPCGGELRLSQLLGCFGIASLSAGDPSLLTPQSFRQQGTCVVSSVDDLPCGCFGKSVGVKT